MQQEFNTMPDQPSPSSHRGTSPEWRDRLAALNQDLIPFRRAFALAFSVIVALLLYLPDVSKEVPWPMEGKAWQYSPEARSKKIRGLLEKNPDDWSLHLSYVLTHPSVTSLNPEYQKLASSTKAIEKDIGKFGLALAFLRNHEPLNATEAANLLAKLDLVADHALFRWHYFRGTTLQTLKRYPESIIEFEREMALHPGKNIATKRSLLEVLYATGETRRALEILSDPESERFSGETGLRICFSMGEWRRFFHLSWKNESLILGKFSVSTFGAAVFSLLLWWHFLRRIDLFEPEPIPPMILAILLGGLSTIFLQSFLTFGLEECLSLKNPGGAPFLLAWKDYLGFYILKVGVIEELLKFLPLLVICLLPGVVNEPVDYLVYASLSALGFAFVENIQYFANPFTTGFVSRGIVCCSIHMVWSSLVAYGMVYSPRWSRLPRLMLFFLLASSLHGIYDISCYTSPFLQTLIPIASWGIWRYLLTTALADSPFFQEELLVGFNNLELELFRGLCLMMGVAILAQACFVDPMLGFIKEITTFATVCLFPLVFSRLVIPRGTGNRLLKRVPQPSEQPTGQAAEHCRRGRISRAWDWFEGMIEKRPSVQMLVYSYSALGAFLGLSLSSLSATGLKGLISGCFFGYAASGSIKDFFEVKPQEPDPETLAKMTAETKAKREKTKETMARMKDFAPSLVLLVFLLPFYHALGIVSNSPDGSPQPELLKMLVCALVSFSLSLPLRNLGHFFPIKAWAPMPLGFAIFFTLTLSIFFDDLFSQAIFGAAMMVGGLTGMGPRRQNPGPASEPRILVESHVPA